MRGRIAFMRVSSTRRVLLGSSGVAVRAAVVMVWKPWMSFCFQYIALQQLSPASKGARKG